MVNLPKNKIILAGVSAGAGIAQWNGLKKSSNDQVKGILTLAAQSTYDLYQWEKIFKDFSLENLRKRFPENRTCYFSMNLNKRPGESSFCKGFRYKSWDVWLNSPKSGIFIALHSFEYRIDRIVKKLF